jgi:hypothetical protein
MAAQFTVSERSEAIQKPRYETLDYFVASLFAMTSSGIAIEPDPIKPYAASIAMARILLPSKA